MSRLPGRVDWWPADSGRWLSRLAGVLPTIHAAPLPPGGLIAPVTARPLASYQPPRWTRYPRVWERAAEIYHQAAPVLPQVLVHGDFHPGKAGDLARHGSAPPPVTPGLRPASCRMQHDSLVTTGLTGRRADRCQDMRSSSVRSRAGST